MRKSRALPRLWFGVRRVLRGRVGAVAADDLERLAAEVARDDADQRDEARVDRCESPFPAASSARSALSALGGMCPWASFTRMRNSSPRRTACTVSPSPRPRGSGGGSMAAVAARRGPPAVSALLSPFSPPSRLSPLGLAPSRPSRPPFRPAPPSSWARRPRE